MSDTVDHVSVKLGAIADELKIKGRELSGASLSDEDERLMNLMIAKIRREIDSLADLALFR